MRPCLARCVLRSVSMNSQPGPSEEVHAFFACVSRSAPRAQPLRYRSNGRQGKPSKGAWIVAVALLAPVTGCEPQAKARTHERASTVQAYRVASPAVSDTSVEREYVAEIRASRYAEIRARLGGIVEAVVVDEGQRVEAGEHLFSIGARHLDQDLAAAKAATAATRAELEAARLEQQNTQLLFDKNVVSAAPLGQANAKVQALEAKLAELNAAAGRAKVQRNYARITAPFRGTINRIPNKVGSVISEEELLTTIADTSEVYAYFRISEHEYLRHRAELEGDGAPEVRLKLADDSTFSEPGVIDAVTNEVDRDTGTITVRTSFQNENGALKHGSSAKVVLRTRIPGAILVPQASTFEVQGNLFVYAVDETNVVHARKIVPKARLNEHFVVGSGLTSADRFVLDGVQQLRDGAEIQILESAPEAIES